jgi:hypothetical protein
MTFLPRHRFGVPMQARHFAILALGLVLLAAPDARAADQISTPSPSDSGERPSVAAFACLAGGLSSVQLTGTAGLTVEVASWLVSARAGLSGAVDFDVSPTEQVEEYGVLVGKAWHRGSRTAYLLAGLGRADTQRRGAFLYKEDEGFGTSVYQKLSDRGWGVPLEAGLAWDGSTTGLSVALVGNVNTRLSLVGIVLGFRFGKLR